MKLGEYISTPVFWMVYVEGRNSPTRKWEKREEAEAEAMRLTIKEGRDAYILEAVQGYAIPEPQTIKIFIDKEPWE